MSPLPFIPDSDQFIAPTTAAPSGSSAVSPQTGTVTLPTAGVYLVTVQVKLQGSVDHMMTGLWLVAYYDAVSNDTLLSTQLGATSKSTGSSFSLSNVTLSNPTSGGVLTASASWGDGQARTAAWNISARRLMAL